MVNWSAPEEIAKDAVVFSNLIYALFGLYVWELFTTCDFEWSLVTRERKFRWPLVLFFFLCRYCILFAFIGLIISFSVSSQINCIALYTFNSWTGNMTILCASTSLMLRTIALWERRLVAVIPLGILCLGHWGLLYRGMFLVSAQWEPAAAACVVTQTNPSLLRLTFFYTMGFDLIILLYSMYALVSKHSARTDLWKLLFTDGLVYFLVTFTSNCIPAVLNVLDLNMMMNVIAAVPAAAISSIAACRAVIRLQEFRSGDVYVHSVSHIISANRSPVTGTVRSPVTGSRNSRATAIRPGVRVVTEQIRTVDEFSPSDGSPYSGKSEGRSSSFDLPIVHGTDEKAVPQHAI